ncbi:MAG: C13 family peptidase [Cellvibrionaceae bacterium]
MCGFIIGALVIENKQYFSDTVAIPVAFLPDGGQYDGELLRGELSDSGRIVWPNGDSYDGEFKNGLFHGLGRYETRGYVYEGEFVRGLGRGKGSITFADGSRYEGDIDFSRANGQGIMKSGESEYIGEFKDNQFYGEGKLIQADGGIYEGEFLDSLFHGKGVFTSTDEEIFQGEFLKGSFTGAGDYRDGEVSYTGSFKDWLFHGEGEYTDEKGVYRGSFIEGNYHGVGIYTEKEGVVYKGSFKNGLYHGEGIMEYEGDRYEGGFEYGMQHGAGKLVYAKPLDNISQIKGLWEYGKLIDSDNPLAEYNTGVIVEDVLYNQVERVEQQLSSIEANDPNRTELYFVGVAGDGGQGVFRRELNYIRDLFDQDYGTKNKSAILINGNVSYKEIPLATLASIEKTLKGVAEKMDAENDILFIYFTSHGSSDFQFQLAQQGLELSFLNSKRMGEIIQSLPIRFKVVVVSACYSGGYVQPVKDDNTMVIVAASADKTSFGCTDASEMTYFGEAFFKDALDQSTSFADAFDLARDIVRGREAKDGFDYSNPLIFKPKAIRQQLSHWRKDLLEWQQEQNRIIVENK